MSYTIEVYRGNQKAEKHFGIYALYVMFYPQLVAGPIERPQNVIYQFRIKHQFDYDRVVSGLRLMAWGLFKKVTIADRLSILVNNIYDNPAQNSGLPIIVATFFFAIQIYCDFSGYSDIALGTARLFGIELLRNFAFPYFSRDIAEFWRRWHISLSTWFRDYLYIPLGGSKGGTLMKVRNTFIIFIVSGFWHGANWTFIFWGLLNALYIMPSIIFNTNRNNLEIVAKGKCLPKLKDITSITITFGLTVFAWIFFRAENLNHAIQYISHMFSNTLLTVPSVIPKILFILLLFFIIVEWTGREEEYAFANLGSNWYKPIRWSMYYAIMLSIYIFQSTGQQFIYFQF